MKKSMIFILLLTMFMVSSIAVAANNAATPQDVPEKQTKTEDWGVIRDQIKEIYLEQGMSPEKAALAVQMVEDYLLKIGVLEIRLVKDPPQMIWGGTK